MNKEDIKTAVEKGKALRLEVLKEIEVGLEEALRRREAEKAQKEHEAEIYVNNMINELPNRIIEAIADGDNYISLLEYSDDHPSSIIRRNLLTSKLKELEIEWFEKLEKVPMTDDYYNAHIYMKVPT